MSDNEFMPWSVWRRDYSTFDSGEWGEDKRFAHKDMAEEYMKSLTGWGTDTRLEGPETPDPSAEPWQSLTLAEFEKTYVMYYGSVYERDSDHGREVLAIREREERRRKEYEEMQALKKIGKKQLP